MRFSGVLRQPDGGGPGLPVTLRLDKGSLTLLTGEEPLGSWGLGEVEARRLISERFLLTIAGEALEFVAEDPLRLAYEGLPLIEGGRGGGLSGWRRRRSRPAVQPAAPATAPPPEPQPAAPATAPPPEPRPERLEIVVDEEIVVETAPEPAEDRTDEPETFAAEHQDPFDAEPLDPEPFDPHPFQPVGAAAPAGPGLLERVRRAGAPLTELVTGRPAPPPDHEHAFTAHRLPGGLVRRVCDCGQVSIGVE